MTEARTHYFPPADPPAERLLNLLEQALTLSILLKQHCESQYLPAHDALADIILAAMRLCVSINAHVREQLP